MLVCEDMTSCTDLAHRHACRDHRTHYITHCSGLILGVVMIHVRLTHNNQGRPANVFILNANFLALKCLEHVANALAKGFI